MKKYLQNRKARLAAGIAVATLTFGVAAPAALADVNRGDDDRVRGNSTLYLDASQVQVAAVVQSGDANAAASDDSVADAETSLSIDQTQVNGGFGDLDLDGLSDFYDDDDDNDGFVDIFE